MSAPISLIGVRDLAARFDTFLLDQFGVLHDGTKPYPGAVAALDALHDAGKMVVLLSNSGKRSAPNEARLLTLGFTPGSWDHFVSSGEVAWRRLMANPAMTNGKCLLIARDNDRSAIDGLPLTLAGGGEDADLVLIAASEGDRFDLEHYRALLAPAARRGTPCLCTNPDKLMLTAAGPRFGAGRIAELYEELGGTVTWIGKPFAEIYAAAMAIAQAAPARTVSIGDSVEHDIAGGAGAGLATALVGTGIHADNSQDDNLALFEKHGAIPDFLLPSFRW